MRVSVVSHQGQTPDRKNQMAKRINYTSFKEYKQSTDENILEKHDFDIYTRKDHYMFDQPVKHLKQTRTGRLKRIKDLANAKEVFDNDYLKWDKIRSLKTSLMSVSRSGMSRTIKVLAVKNNRIIDVSHVVAEALQYSQGKNGGVIVHGCGMDMGFSLISNLSYLINSVYGEIKGKNAPTQEYTRIIQSWI